MKTLIYKLHTSQFKKEKNFTICLGLMIEMSDHALVMKRI